MSMPVRFSVMAAAVVVLAASAFAAEGQEPKAPAPGSQAGPAGGFAAASGVEEEFKALDTDGDGQLSVREYARSVMARREFMACDKDRDAKVTKEEFIAYQPGQGVASPEGGGPGMFERFDANKDGAITEAEATRMWRFLSMADANGDGKLTKAEFDASRAAMAKSQQDRRAEQFGQLDKDGDGSLSFVELLARMAPERGAGAPGAQRPAARLREMDKNGDGRISKDEFTGPEERFKALDKNGDGVLDVGELLGAIRGAGGRRDGENGGTK